VLKAGVAQSVARDHPPFDVGNGRIARAIADMQLARSEHEPQRYLQHVRADPSGAERGITTSGGDPRKASHDHAWLAWFLACLDRAFDMPKTFSRACSRRPPLPGNGTPVPFSTIVSATC